MVDQTNAMRDARESTGQSRGGRAEAIRAPGPMPEQGVAERQRHSGLMPPRREGQEPGTIEAMMEALSEEVGHLNDRAGLLATRLAGVLEPDTPPQEVTEKAPERANLCPIAEGLRMLTRRVVIVQELVASTLKRLQL